MIRMGAAIAGGLIAWFVSATLGNLLFRTSWPGYVEVEASMTFTSAMMLGRLGLGALSSLCAGVAAAWISKGNGTAAKSLGVVLTAMFIPIHYALWDKFPLWYHALFLGSLFPGTLAGAYLFNRCNRRVESG